MSRISMLGSLGLAVVLLATGPAGTFAAGQPGKVAKAADKVTLTGLIGTFTATSVTVMTTTGSTIVQFGPKTVYVNNGQKSATVPPFTAGEKIQVVATRAADGSLTAVRITVGQAPKNPNAVQIKGTAAVSGTTIVVVAQDGTKTTVQIGPKTVFTVGGKKVTSLPALTAQQQVTVAALKQADGSLLATRIAVAAPKPGKRINALKGTITVVAASSITVTTTDKKVDSPVTVDFGPNTKFYVNGSLASAAPTFTVGEKVLLSGNHQADGSVLAGNVAVGVFANKPGKGAGKGKKPAAARVMVNGAFTASSATSISLTLANGTSQVIQIGAKTTFVVDGQVVTVAPQFTAGEKIRVVATKAADGTLTAVRVAVGQPPKNPNAVQVKGTATVAGSTITVVAKNGTSTAVQIGPSTKFTVAGKKATSLPALTPQQQVVVAALKQADGTLLATHITVVTPRAPAQVVHVQGTFVADTATSLTVQSAGGTQSVVQFGAKTKFRLNGAAVTALPALTTAARVNVTAARQTDGTLLARLIVIRMK